MTDHADFEDLSAFVDGEAPEWAPHLDRCAACRATVEELRGVQAALATPMEPVDAAARDRAIAAATSAVMPAPAPGPAAAPAPGPAPVPAPVPIRPPPRWPVPASIAALFLVVVGAVSLVAQGGRTTDESDTAGPAFESSTQADNAAGGGSSSLAAAPPANLGEVPDAATLLDRARPGLLNKESAPVVAPAPASGATDAARSSGNSGATAAAGGSSAGATVRQPRPCEDQARAREPGLQDVVYVATATRRGVPAYVLGFSTGPAPAPVTLLLLAQDGCGVLLRAAGP